MPPVLRPKIGAAIIQQIELDIAAATDQLLVALGLASRAVQSCRRTRCRIDAEERAPDVLYEGEVAPSASHRSAASRRRCRRRRAARCDAAGRNTRRTRLSAWHSRRACAGAASCMAFERRHRMSAVILGGVAASSTGVRSAPPPNQARGRDHMARVHVDGRHVGVPRMRNQRNAGGPEARILLGARHLLAELGANSPYTVEMWTPTFSNTRPRVIAITPPPGAPVWSARLQGVRTSWARRHRAWPALRPPIARAQRRCRRANASNHARARTLRASRVAGSRNVAGSRPGFEAWLIAPYRPFRPATP